MTANLTFTAAAAALSDETAKEAALTLVRNIDTRAAFEKAKNADNAKIQATLDNVRATFGKSSVARFCVAAGIDLNFINRTERTGAHFNVYAALKEANIAEVTMNDKAWNAINVAIVKSLFKCAKAEIEFSHKIAVACCSKNITIDAGVSRHLVRHTVSPTTASTQASSTMNALQVCGVVSEYKNESGLVCYRLADTPLTAAIREKVGF